MTDADDQPNRLTEIARLAAMIADRILEQNEAGTRIPPEQFTMLVRAARALLDNDVPWPPQVEYVIMEVAKRVEQTQAPPTDQVPAEIAVSGAQRLTEYLNVVPLKRR